LLGDDFSFTNAMLVIATLIVLDVGLSLAKLNSKPLARLLDGYATLVVEHGRFLHHRMHRARLTEDDILEAARDSQGIEKVEHIKFAIVERNGKISIIPCDNLGTPCCDARRPGNQRLRPRALNGPRHLPYRMRNPVLHDELQIQRDPVTHKRIDRRKMALGLWKRSGMV